MADKIISLRIPDAKVTTALQGFLKIFPNIETVSEEDDTLLYTSSEWVTEKIRRNTIRDIRRGLQMSANEAVQIASDDSLVETG